MTDAKREAIGRYGMARRADPAWAKQCDEQLLATMMAELRNYPYSWLASEHVTKWMPNAQGQQEAT
jgi:hypothetical protein